MKCYHCGAVSDVMDSVCPHCRKDMEGFDAPPRQAAEPTDEPVVVAMAHDGDGESP